MALVLPPGRGARRFGTILPMEETLQQLKADLAREKEDKEFYLSENEHLHQQLTSLSISFDKVTQRLTALQIQKNEQENKFQQKKISGSFIFGAKRQEVVTSPRESTPKPTEINRVVAITRVDDKITIENIDGRKNLALSEQAGEAKDSELSPSEVTKPLSAQEKRSEGDNPYVSMFFTSQEMKCAGVKRSKVDVERRMQQIILSLRSKNTPTLHQNEKIREICGVRSYPDLTSKRLYRHHQRRRHHSTSSSSRIRNRNEIMKKWHEREATRAKTVLALSKNLNTMTSLVEDVTEPHILGNGSLFKDQYYHSDEEDSQASEKRRSK